MQRYAINQLLQWKNNPGHMPLIVRGARQVGKTWLMREFGRKHYKKMAYFSFDNSPRLANIFQQDMNIQRIIDNLDIEAGIAIRPHDTLIIFDEIQECPLALTSLKYFCENAPEYDIIAAGSLLGVASHKGTGFPVGKVEYLNLYPLSFREFLLAMGEESLLKIIEENRFDMQKIFKDRLTDCLRRYCYIGGMPKVVSDFCNTRDYQKARRLQKNILADYENDFSKHIPAEQAERARLLWYAIPSQLVKENKKCVYGRIKEGARSKDFELALNWLIDAGLVYKISRITEPKIPLKAYEDVSAYKLFLLDTGLLAAMNDINAKTILENDALFNNYNGAITEQYVLQELKTIDDIPIFYWANNRSEIDFMIQYGSNVIPVEAKATINLQAKSLKSFRQKYSPAVSVRTSLADYEENNGLWNIPLYSISGIKKILPE